MPTAVDHRVDVRQQRLPDVAGGEGLEVGLAQLDSRAGGRAASASARLGWRVPITTAWPRAAQRGGGMPPDEPGAAQDQYSHCVHPFW